MSYACPEATVVVFYAFCTQVKSLDKKYLVHQFSWKKIVTPPRKVRDTHLYFNQHPVMHLDLLVQGTRCLWHVHNHYWSGVFQLVEVLPNCKEENWYQRNKQTSKTCNVPSGLLRWLDNETKKLSVEYSIHKEVVMIIMHHNFILSCKYKRLLLYGYCDLDNLTMIDPIRHYCMFKQDANLAWACLA